MRVHLAALLILALLPNGAGAQASRLRTLDFDADRNGLQILAQRFEYMVDDNERLQIGDLALNATRFRLEFEPGPRNLVFRWPRLISGAGRLSILNNVGKAVWSRDLATMSLETEASEVRDEIRDEVVIWSLKGIAASTIEELSSYPFFRFCLSREEPRSRLFFCSRDYYLSKTSGTPVLTERSRLSRESSVEINGTGVEPQGLIYLNSPEESLFLRVQTRSGTLFEITTRRREVEFLDVILQSEETLRVTARGAPPTQQGRVDFDAEGRYHLLLSRQRPYFYIEGEGGIPMRQEFHVRGEPPLAAWRVHVASSSPTRSFAKEVELLGVHPGDVQLKNYDAKGDLSLRQQRQFVWVLKDLEAGKANRRYLLVEAPNKGRYTASYEILRGYQDFWSFGLRHQLPSGDQRGRARYERTFESFLGSYSSWANFRWLLGIEYDQHLTSRGGSPYLDHLEVDLTLRFPGGLMMQDEGWLVSLGFGSMAVNGTKSTHPLLRIKKMFRTGSRFNLDRWADWLESGILFRSGSGSVSPRLQSYTELFTHAYLPLERRSWFRYGLSISGGSTDTPEGNIDWQMGLDAGVTLAF